MRNEEKKKKRKKLRRMGSVLERTGIMLVPLLKSAVELSAVGRAQLVGRK